jgi:hypothetical protein
MLQNAQSTKHAVIGAAADVHQQHAAGTAQLLC